VNPTKNQEIAPMSGNGLITLRSANDFATTLGRLSANLEAKAITIFARIDHAAGAANIGLFLRPTTLLIFGNPAAGTPLMQRAQTAGIDLPLKILVWEDADGATNLSYNDPPWIAARHDLGSESLGTVTAMAAALKALALHAAGS
jgi:uncharacterized protein (DUF302 family)